MTKTTLFHLTESALWCDFPRSDKFQGRLPVMPRRPYLAHHRSEISEGGMFWVWSWKVYPRICGVFPAKAKFGLLGMKLECRNYLELKCYKWKQKKSINLFYTTPKRVLTKGKFQRASTFPFQSSFFPAQTPLETVALNTRVRCP